jgi:Flagellar motor protein
MAVLHKGDVAQPLKSLSDSLHNSSIVRIFDGGDKIRATGDITSVDDNRSYELIQKYIKENQLQDLVDITKENSGIALELRVELLFDIGSADIKPGSKTILNKISLLLNKFANNIVIKGYTDNQPISSDQYPSNWELSSDRAVKILRYFTEQCGLDSKRFTAQGYGDNNPVASNDTAKGRQKNRRVEIFIAYNTGNE